MLLLVVGLFGSGLNEYAVWSKEFPEVYKSIKAYSANECGNDRDKVIKEINIQSEYFYFTMGLIRDNPDNDKLRGFVSILIFDIRNNNACSDWVLVFKIAKRMVPIAPEE